MDPTTRERWEEYKDKRWPEYLTHKHVKYRVHVFQLKIHDFVQFESSVTSAQRNVLHFPQGKTGNMEKLRPWTGFHITFKYQTLLHDSMVSLAYILCLAQSQTITFLLSA